MTDEEIKISLDYIASMASDIKDILKYDYEISEKLTEMEYCSNIENEAEKIIKALVQESITWIVGKDNCQVAVRNMPIDKMQKICAIIEEEGQQPCEDCISRKAVEKITWEEPSYDDALNVLTEVRDKVRVLPSVTPQRPKGKWLDKKTTIKGAHGLAYGRYGCSVCKRKFPAKSNFCPNCGADMRGEEDEVSI